MARKKSTTRRAEQAPDANTRICVLHGPEQMRKQDALRQLRGHLESAHGDVETIRFDGKAAELADVLDELRSYGLMQQYKVVIVDDADPFVSAHREALERYAQAPVDNATLVLRADRWYKGKLDKLIEKVGCLIRCDPPKRPEAVQWVQRRAPEVHARPIERDAADILVARVGVDLMRLDAELGKLALLTAEGRPITAALIDEVVARSSDEQAWMVQEAVLAALTAPPRRGANAGGVAIEKLHELIDLSRQPDVLVAYFVADLVRKLHAAVAMKRQGVPGGEIARQMRMFGPRQTLFMNLLRRLDERTTAEMFDRIVELDVRSKTGRGEAMRNLEGFCATLADRLR